MRTCFPKGHLLDFRLVAGLAAALALLACSKDSSPSGPGPTLVDKDYLSLGWHQFEAQHYDSAATSFTSAYTMTSTEAIRAEALCGRGWSSMYKRDLAGAKADLALALGAASPTAGVTNDARAGEAFTLYALNMYSDAASYAYAALTDNPAYVFAHDAKVTAKRLRLLLVQSYYATGQFVLAAAQLDIFDPARSPHSSDPTILLGTITAALNSL